MTEMKLTRNSDFPWIKILFKKIDENRKKLVSIKKYYNKKRRSLRYRNNNDFVMKSNTINNEEHIKLCFRHVVVMTKPYNLRTSGEGLRCAESEFEVKK